MTDPRPESAEAREAAAIRRRWITLGEVLAVIGVLISALALWNSYKERSSTEAERAAEKQEEKAKAQTLVLKAVADGKGKRLTLSALDPGQAIQSQTLLFPSAFHLGAFDTTEPRIEADWVKRAVKKAQEKDRNVRGDARIPVAITSRFVADGEAFSETALYDVGYKLDDGGLLGGTEVELRGLSLIGRAAAAKAQARLDAVWKSRAG